MNAAKREAEYAEQKAEATAMGDLEGFLEAQSMRNKRSEQTSADRKGGENDQEKEEEETKNDEEDENSLDGLKAKVKRLQLQIRIQVVLIFP